jgi:O-antigen/teichoic acid export membrane protein
MTVALEISQAVARFYGEAQNPKDKVSYTSTALYFSITMYCLVSLLIFTFYKEISELLFDTTENANLILFVIPWFALHGINYFITNQLRWENRTIPYIVLKTINAVLMLLALIMLIQQNEMGINGVVYAYIISLTITAIIGIGTLIRFKSLSFNLCKIKLKEMLTFSFPLVPSSAAIFAQSYIDRIMISKMLDLENLGLYSFAFKVASALTLITTTFQMSITPIIYKTYKDKETPEQIAKSFNLSLFFMFSATIGLCLFLPELFHFFIGESFHSSAYLIPVLCFSVILSSIYIFAPGIYLSKKTKFLAFINLTGMLINAALNIILIKLMGVMGAAIATILSLIVVVLLTFVLSIKLYPIPYHYKRIAAGTILTIVSLLLISKNSGIEFTTLSLSEFFIKIGVLVILSSSLFLIFKKN